MKNYKSTETLFLSVVSVLGGIVLVFAGVVNTSRLFQFINSSLDAAYQEEEPLFGLDSSVISYSDSDQEDFLPVFIPTNHGNAPDLELPDSIESQPADSDTTGLTSQAEVIEEDGNPVEEPQVAAPERLIIKSMGIDSQIIPVTHREVEYLGDKYQQWIAPKSGDLGWHSTSAMLGEVGNVVINGHNSGFGETFRDLDQLENGDFIEVYAGNSHYTYVVANSLVLKERWENVETRMENASWINPSEEARLTLISCWPNDSSTHRVVIVAIPYAIGYVAKEMTSE